MRDAIVDCLLEGLEGFLAVEGNAFFLLTSSVFSMLSVAPTAGFRSDIRLRGWRGSSAVAGDEDLGDSTLEDEEGRAVSRVCDADRTVLEGRVSLEEEAGVDAFDIDVVVVEDVDFGRVDDLVFGLAIACAPELLRPRTDRGAFRASFLSSSSSSSDAGTTSGIRWRFLGGCAVGMLTVILAGFVENATETWQFRCSRSAHCCSMRDMSVHQRFRVAAIPPFRHDAVVFSVSVAVAISPSLSCR